MDPVLIVGCGYLGRRVAALEQSEGARVTGVVRSAGSARSLEKAGIEPRIADLDAPETLEAMPLHRARVYYLAPPPSSGTTDPRIEALLAQAEHEAARPRRVVLLSTTGVYGDCHGEWVDERRAPRPQADRARRRLAAEQVLQTWAARTGIAAVILRVPGIYGPGRLPVERLRKGAPVLQEDEAPYSNRIHVDDLARACLAAARRGRPGAVYNASDGQPTTMTDYFFQVADALGLPRPPVLDREQARRELSTGMLSYLAESKRIDNRRLREELGVEFQYPDLARGLASCLGE